MTKTRIQCRFCSVPSFVPTQLFQGRKNAVLRWMDIAGGNSYRAVPSDPSKCPNVASGRAQASKKSFFRLLGSKWPLIVGAGHTQPSRGLPASSQRCSSIFLTRGVIGNVRRAAAVFPCVTNNVP